MADAANSERRMLRTKQAATYANLSEGMLRKLRLIGGGPEYIKLGRVVVYDPNDLEKWIAANRRRATSVAA
ncbi:helix-turn-helix domain-containing protein [Rhizobium calliandrae]|uniref:Helix-turn-helix domain-containing protein n=1 Tax=Rhizobium calliandrae TaxID=1312182 RepID=A0ABT7KJJ8_9HYPH|nr:helix-turn-helix domain-containing protein [Rhizobium calliandrae]MDL2408742.1 helix-turn-helix domain-containing protein [Rhizobium calliandrae]